MPYVLAGLLALVLVPGAIVAISYAAGKTAARWLGIPEFRLLTAGAPGTGWKRFGVRSASSAAAFLLCFALAFGAAKNLGTTEPTMTVRVLDGPAKRAGIEDGDRIVAVDDRPVAEWNAMRDAVRAGAEHTLTVERRGQRITRVVTPNAERRIGLEQHLEQRQATAGESLETAFAMCFLPVRALWQPQRPRSELAGPVAIVKEVQSSRSNTSGSFLWILAVVASYAWLVVLACHIVDALLSTLRRRGS
jgi:PDZ domain-containing protein